jgi:hypothetical protein
LQVSGGRCAQAAATDLKPRWAQISESLPHFFFVLQYSLFKISSSPVTHLLRSRYTHLIVLAPLPGVSRIDHVIDLRV